MPLYAQHPALRARQVAADLGMLAWTVLWVLVARAVHRAVLVLAEPGRAVEDLGESVAGTMNSAAEAAGDVPLVGDDLSAPFAALSEAGGSVRGAGQAAQDAVGTLASVLAVVLVVLPVGWLLLRWLPWRLDYAREAGAAAAAADRHPGPGDPRRPGAGHRAPAPARRPAGRHRRRLAGRRPRGVRALAGLELRGSACACRLPARPVLAAQLTRASLACPVTEGWK